MSHELIYPNSDTSASTYFRVTVTGKEVKKKK